MDTQAYALTKKVAASAVSGVKSMSVEGQTLVINTKDSGVLKMVFPKPKDAATVTDIDVNDKNQIVFTMSNGEKFISGVIPTVKGEDGKPGKDGKPFTYEDFTGEQLDNLKVKGDPGKDGKDGTDGFSPTVKVEKVGNKSTITITDKEGTTTADVLDGDGASTWSEISDKPFETLGSDFTVSEDGELKVVGGTGDSSSGEENVIESIKVNGVKQTVDKDKSVDITVPDVTGFITEKQLDEKGYLTEHQDLTDYAKKTEIPDTTNLVEKEDGKGLSTNDYTAAEKEKLAKLENYDDSAISGRVDTIETSYAKKTDIPEFETVDIDFTMVSAESPLL